MRFVFLIILLVLLSSCTSIKPSGRPPGETSVRLKVKYENVLLSAPAEWVGGTKENPRYFTFKGEEIITPLLGVDVVPVTKRSVDDNGRVLYPHLGYQVTGDLKLEHYLLLMKKLVNINFKRNTYKAPEIVADSNFLEKGALVFDETGELVAEYEFKALGWHVKK